MPSPDSSSPSVPCVRDVSGDGRDPVKNTKEADIVGTVLFLASSETDSTSGRYQFFPKSEAMNPEASISLTTLLS